MHSCDKCSKRLYCSKECQAADWAAGHEHWCGTAGELNHDYEIRPSMGRGLGVFALRSFERNDRIMVERPVVLGLLCQIHRAHVQYDQHRLQQPLQAKYEASHMGPYAIRGGAWDTE